MAEKTIGIAIAGTGFGQKVHLPGFQHHHRTEVVSIYNRDLAKAQSIAEAHGVTHWGDRLEAVLENPAVDAVALSTPPFLHYDMAKQILEAGKHLLIEKPITLNATEAKELYQIAAAKNLVVTPDFEFRFVPAWQMFAEYLQNDFVGKKRLITINWIVTSRANPDRAWNWYAQESKGGGALGAVGSHAFDYINWLFGGVKSILGHLSCAIPQRPDPLENSKLKPVDADDTCMIMLELADGTPCQLNISSVTYHGRGHWVEVYGEKGSLVLGSSNLKDYVHGFTLKAAKAGEELQEVAISEKYEFPQTFADGRLAPFIRVADHFAKCIDSNEAIAPTLKEGVYSQILMDLTHQSNAERRWLDVPDLDSFLVG